MSGIGDEPTVGEELVNFFVIRLACHSAEDVAQLTGWLSTLQELAFGIEPLYTRDVSVPSNGPSVTEPGDINDTRLLDQICDEFESNWSPDTRPDFESYLNRVDPSLRDRLLQMLLGVDIELRRKADQTILPNDYVDLGEKVLRFVDQLVENDADMTIPPDSSRMEMATTAPQQSTSGALRQIGPYKLLQQIGEGGMGSVWMAEQEKPVRRRVALKLIRGDMGSKETVARFEAERQALAMMDHQNIAKVLDAGTTENGSPYFVMELVKGIPFTQYCDDNKLSIRERLELFVPVCKAVQHAHQKGIIHRDLKPSNVLVTLYDGEAVPKVIDFGLAKALEHTTKLTDRTMFTEFGKVVGTIQYMAPEQAEMNALDVDTRADIYSLGVMLYELLTGSTPLEKEAIGKNAILQVLAIIKEKEPPRPSARLSESGDAIVGISYQRQISPSRLQQILRGELDWVVMRALEKDRRRRYESAANFADDVDRYLNDEAVEARPPSAIYRLSKFVKKNRSLVGTAATIAIVLIVGIAVAIWFGIKANSMAASERASRERLNEKRYSSLISLALSQYENGRLVEALQTLEETATENRGWEFDYFQTRFNSPRGKYEATLQSNLIRDRFDSSSNSITCYDLSPNGKFIAGGGIGLSKRKESKMGFDPDCNPVFVWDRMSGKIKHLLIDHTDQITAIAIAPNSQLIASGSKNGEVIIWDVSQAKKVKTLQIPKSNSYTNEIANLIFVQSGSKLVVNSPKHVSMFETSTWLESERIDASYSIIAVSRNGQQLAGAAGLRNLNRYIKQSIEIVNLNTREKTILPGHAGFISSLCFSPDGKTLYSNSGGSNVHEMKWSWSYDGRKYDTGMTVLTPELGNCEIGVWNVESGLLVGKLGGNGKDTINSIALSNDGKLIGLAFKDDNLFELWNAETGEYVKKLVALEPITRTQFSPDGGAVLLNNKIYSVAGNDVAMLEEPASQMAISHDDRYLFARAERGNSVEIIETESLATRPSINLEDRFPNGSTRFGSTRLVRAKSIDAFPNSLIIAVGRGAEYREIIDGEVKPIDVPGSVDLVEVASGFVSKKLEGPAGHVGTITIAESGERIAIHWGKKRFAEKSRLSIFSSSGELNWQKELVDVEAVAISNSGEQFLTASDHGIELWSVGKNVPMWNQDLFGEQQPPKSTVDKVVLIAPLSWSRVGLEWSPDGTAFAFWANKMIRLSRISDGGILWEYRVPSSSFSCLQFANDGSRLFCGCDDGTIKILNTNSGEFIAELNGHSGRVSDIIFANNSDVLFSADSNGEIRRWRPRGQQ